MRDAGGRDFIDAIKKRETRRVANYVGFTFGSGKSDAEYPLLEALRTKPGVPRPVANDPKRN